MRVSSLILLAAGLRRACASTKGGVDLVSHEEDELMLLERSLASNIWQEIKDVATCTGCEAILVLLKGLSWLGEGAFVNTLQEICKISNAEDDDVCEGAIGLEGPIIHKAIKDMGIPSKTSKLFCINFLGVCDYPDVEAWNVPFPSEKPQGLSRPVPSGEETIRVVHYSDIHVDHLYEAGATANCSKPICCRPYTADDEPGKSTSPAGPMGDHKCDVPVSLEESMYAAIKDIVPDAAFTIFTGDIVDHAVWDTSQEYNTFSINDTYNRMANSLGLVYGTIGNHEANPTNAFPASSTSSSAQWVYDLVSTSWTRWIGAEAASETKSQGTYSIKYPGGNLRIISLNTNMYYVQNYWLYRKTMARDPNDQFQWLVSELDAAEKAGERVYIIGHMPVGDHNAFHDQSNYLDQIVNRYSDTIAAMFYGHTHKDHFQISYSDYASRTPESASMVSYIGPSLTPTSGMPSFRVYLVDPQTFAILDTETYIADMSNPSFQTAPVWTKYYSAKESYAPLVGPEFTDPTAELTPAFWHKLTDVFAANQRAFDGYLARKSRGWDVEVCEGQCRDDEICQLRAARAESNCYEPQPGVNFKKRAENPFEERDECGISVGRATVGALAVRADAIEILTKAVGKAATRS